MTNNIVTLVGARDMVTGDAQKIWVVTGLLNRLGYTGRSGGAPGMDNNWALNMKECQVILPNNGFQGLYHNGSSILALEYAPISLHKKAIMLAREHHHNWEYLNEWARKAHTRNVMQVLGATLEDHSEFTVYAAPETKYGKVSGGTATAVAISRSYGIPTYNLRIESQYEALLAFLKGKLESNLDS